MKSVRNRVSHLMVLTLLAICLTFCFVPAEVSFCQIENAEKSLAPFVPTPMNIVRKMLEMAEVKKGDVVYDLGCGDGRIVVMAAKEFGARGVGVDIDPQRIEEARAKVKENKIEDLVTIRQQDAMTVDLSEATVVTLYLLPKSNQKLQANLEKYLKPGVRVVSHSFGMEGWKEKKYEHFDDANGFGHSIYLWIIGEQKEKK